MRARGARRGTRKDSETLVIYLKNIYIYYYFFVPPLGDI